ncbi:AI-2E family transporter [Variovorax defluvii]|uniref:AI-2E family transporter n=1 Tax=Variovorax defluvii TaxID=913761 RepID=A0ABP8GQ46_9BURK
MSDIAPPLPSRRLQTASYLLIAGALLLIMWQGLLPGLLCVCVGFLGTRWLARLMDSGRQRLQPSRPAPVDPPSSGARVLAATLVSLAPVGLLTLAFSETREFVLNAPEQYQELLDFIARTVLELRLKLPPDIGVYLPEGAAEVQGVIAGYLRAQAGALALTGRAWLGGLLFAYVGLIVGALAAVARHPSTGRPLAEMLKQRITLFGEAFGQIVAAQFWIAAFNTLLTAIFLLFMLPLWKMELPYTPALITLTFVAGLVPIVGNLLCNTVITLVGLAVSPLTALACLAFLILIHKAEYFINAKVVGARTQMGVWELLAVMFVAEAVFGPAGLVAAPLFYAYLKKELQAARLV